MPLPISFLFINFKNFDLKVIRKKFLDKFETAQHSFTTVSRSSSIYSPLKAFTIFCLILGKELVTALLLDFESLFSSVLFRVRIPVGFMDFFPKPKK